MTTSQLRWLFAALLLSALVLAGCTSDEGDDTTLEDGDEAPADTSTDEGDTEAPDDTDAEEPTEPAEEPDDGEPAASGDRISTHIGQPESLTPTNNTESEGGQVLQALFTTLIEYDAENNYEPVMANAESIETEDNQTYTVTLKDGWTFHDGTPVTAESYVNAWNYAAFAPNAQSVAGFFTPIAGYEDVQCGQVTGEDGEEVADCEGSPPASETMSGLTVDSETQFTVELAEPEAFFVTRLGYSSYAPLPDVFYDDPEAFDRAPIGNGPLMMNGEWEDDQVINTDAFPDFQGDQAMQIPGIEFRIYADVNTAVTDLVAGNLDIVPGVPAEQWESTISQVPNSDQSDSSSINYIGFPTYAEPYDNPTMRAALSMAIDREEITEGIFNGLNAPAGNILSPVIPGYQETVEGCDAWSYNPDMAAELFEEAGGVEALGDTVEIWFNEGAAHDLWIDTVVTQWERNLGIPATSVQFQQLPFAEYLEIADAAEFTGAFRLGWGMDYPHPQNYLQILLELTADEGGNNATFWTNEEYSGLVSEALAFPDVEESLPTWQEAATVACNDAPVAPIFYGQNTYAWNDTVGNVFVDAFSTLDYTALTAG